MPLRIPVNYTGIYDATSLITHQASSSLTQCVCVHVVAPIGGTVIGVTSYSSNLTGVPGYSGVTFKSTSGASASKVEHPDDAGPSNLEIDLFLVTAGITEADALSGKWAHAPATVFVCNYEALNMGQMVMNEGFLSEFVQKGSFLTSEIRGLNQALVQQIGRVTRAECDADYGDDRCGLDLVALGYIKTGTLTHVTSQTVIRDNTRGEGAHYFTNGKFKITGGDNNGYEFEVDTYDSATGTWTLRKPFPYLPAVGNTYQATKGCRKNFEAHCVGENSNAVNFRGFPHIPTAEQMTRMPLS